MNIAIECKECRGTNLPFSRLTQLDKMIEFDEALSKNLSLFIICFWKGSKKKSNYYMICADTMKTIMENSTKKSANEKDLESYRKTYKELKIFFS